MQIDPQTMSQINQLGGDVERRAGKADMILCNDTQACAAISGLLTEMGISHRMPTGKTLLLTESQSITEASANNNAGNMMIGQTVDVLVTDAAGTEFLRPMQCGEFYPDNSVLMRDIDTQDSLVMQFDHDESNKLRDGLVYLNVDPSTGVVYKLVVSSNLLSSQSITSHFVNESFNASKSGVKLVESHMLGRQIKSNAGKY